MLESTRAILLKLWKDQDIQVMVLISLTVQLFLLFTGNLRRRRINWLLRLIIWLAYVGADAVAVFAIGLMSGYEEKYKLRSRYSSGDHSHMLPFLWGPFLLIHLGGQDKITAFSIEDNNLWLRHLLNLMVQVTLTLYVFWKSFDILDFQLLVVAVPIFIAGLIKYGERTWALYSGSRDYLSVRKEGEEKPLQDFGSTSGDMMACYALNTVLRARGLLVGRTLFHLNGNKFESEVVDDFKSNSDRDWQLKVVLMELGTMYDLLYTKAMVLHSMSGRILRCVAEICMVIALVLFVANSELHAHNRADVAITYTLLSGAIFMEAYSVSMVTVSPWTRARSKRGTFLCRLSCSASSFLDAIMQRMGINMQQPRSSFSMGQFNLADCYMSEKCTPKIISALGLERKWRTIWHIQHVEDREIAYYIRNFLLYGEGYQQLENAKVLKDVLNMELHQAILRLHIATDLHLSSQFYDDVNNGRGHPEPTEKAVLAADCRKLSNYFMHLMTVHPNMLPVSTAAQDLEQSLAKWVRKNRSGTMSKAEFLNKYAEEELARWSPFGLLTPSVASLTAIKQVWARLLIYAAGKCPAEEHARQLSNGLELLTCVWLLMVHHDVGDLGSIQVSLLEHIGDGRRAREKLFLRQDIPAVMRMCIGPLHAFKFRQHEPCLAQPRSRGVTVLPEYQPTSFILAPWSPVNEPPQQPGTSLETETSSDMERTGSGDHVVVDIDAESSHRRHRRRDVVLDRDRPARNAKSAPPSPAGRPLPHYGPRHQRLATMRDTLSRPAENADTPPSSEECSDPLAHMETGRFDVDRWGPILVDPMFLELEAICAASFSPPGRSPMNDAGPGQAQPDLTP